MSEKLSELEERLGISRTYMASVGYFLMAFSGCELRLNHAIQAALKLEQTSGGEEVVTAIRDFGQRMILLSRVGKRVLKSEKNRKDCSNIIRSISFLNDERVDLVHGEYAAWIPDLETVVYEKAAPTRDGIDRRYPELSTDYLCELTEYALQVQFAFQIFVRNLLHGSELSLPSLDKRPQRRQQVVPQGRN
jgi:hypothetical protein